LPRSSSNGRWLITEIDPKYAAIVPQRFDFAATLA
jgi:hypothetical protein